MSEGLNKITRMRYIPPTGRLWDIFCETRGVNKWHQYFETYERELGHLQNTLVRVLEIGVSNGGSLSMWRKWFGPDAILVGLDILDSCAQFDDPGNNTHVRIGDQKDKNFLSSVSDELGPFDVILDDGGHMTSQQIASFGELFRHGLTDRGLYIIEDTHSNVWGNFVDSKITMLELSKALIDQLYRCYSNPNGPSSLVDYELGGPVMREGLPAAWIERWLKRLAFYDSIIVLEKGERSVPVSEDRMRAAEPGSSPHSG